MTNSDYKLRPFRFWCQKVLPLVYDDSLSYYELLCKVVDYINNIIVDLNATEQGLAELNDYTKNYFANLDVQDEIDNKLDEMVQDGTLTAIIAEYVNNLILPSTGDTTDRTAEIVSLLNSNGICRLGSGDFYITGVNMPNGSIITGCGNRTRVIVSDGASNYGFKLNSGCKIQNFMLTGNLTDITSFGENPGGRHGIIWEGTASVDGNTVYRGTVTNMFIENFNGGGIYMNDTGGDPQSSVCVSDSYIRRCWAGIYIKYFSEYHRFTNVKSTLCRIGCLNNGGNNIFVACDFSWNLTVAFSIDNTTGLMRNIGHGMCIGCLFNHTESEGVANSGIGIRVLGNDNGFIFSGCSIFFSTTIIHTSSGVVFNGMNYGYENCDIYVYEGASVMFLNSTFQTAVPITITDNEHVIFDNDYTRLGAPITLPVSP